MKIRNFYCEGSSAPIFFTDENKLELWNNSNKKDKFFLVKDNFWSKELPTTASSNFLSLFFPAEDATVIKLLKEKGYMLLGKSILDEFACGGTGLFSNKGKITNPHNINYLSGGSSSGSAYSVAKKIVPFSIGHDTGDSVRRPASYCGVIGFKPSYGLISRYGVIPMASSLDTVGIFSLDIKVVREIFNTIAKIDYRDMITLTTEKEEVKIINSKKIAIIKGIENFLSKEYSKIYLKKIKSIKNLKEYQICEIEIPQIIRENLQISYIIICSSELVSHLNSLQGVTYGDKSFDKKIKNKRSELIGKWVKERILFGNYFLSEENFLKKAKKLREITKNWVNKLFLEFDLFVFPGTRGKALENNLMLEDYHMKQSHWSDNLLLIANFAGNPSINIPIGKEDGMPVSLNIDGPRKNEKVIFDFVESILKK